MGLLRTFIRYVSRYGSRGGLAVAKYYLLRASATLWGPGRTCSCCFWIGKEFAPRLNVWDGSLIASDRCPRCNSYARHRAYAEFYRRFFPREELRDARVMHFAAEDCFEFVIPGLCGIYDRSNYESPGEAPFAVDLEKMELADASYNVFLMHHVLCCVWDDRRAIAEMHRCLRPGGVVLAAEELRGAAPTTDFGERGYGGMCRIYGDADLAARFAPFSVEVVDVTQAIDKQTLEGIGARPLGHILVLRKNHL